MSGGAKQSAYLKVKDAVMSRIRAGDWKPGDLIPKEEDLARDFGCARMTANRALRELAEEGVIERRKRAGSRVALQTGRNALFEIPRVDKEIEATGAAYRYRLLERKIAEPAALARSRLGLEPGEKALKLICLHHANETPFQLEERWINLAAAPEAAAESFQEINPNLWLLERLPWSEVEHVVSAVNASPWAAKRLEVPEGEALLLVERRTWNEEARITYARFLHPGRFYSLRAGGLR
jgi:GntR family histidine utilization transcriptional repressor